MSAANAIPYANQFGGYTTAMVDQFSKMRQGATMGQAMGGGLGAATGAIGALGGVASGAARIAGAQSGKERAQGALDIGAAAASAAGPWGMVAAAPLQLVSALLNIKGPRQKKRERRRQRQQQALSNIAQASQGAIMVGQGTRSGGLSLNQPTTLPPYQAQQSFEPQQTPPGAF